MKTHELSVFERLVFVSRLIHIERSTTDIMCLHIILIDKVNRYFIYVVSSCKSV